MHILSSNIVNIMLTCLMAYAVSFVPKKVLIVVFKVASVIISICIIYSYIFDVGEVVYIYEYYKRAFFIFDDGINVTLIFLYFILLNQNNIVYSQLILIAFFMAFGKMALILLVMCMFTLLFYYEIRKKILKRFFMTLLVAMTTVFVAINLTYYLYDNDNFMQKGQSIVNEELVILEREDIKVSHDENHCGTCFITWPLQIRLMSFVAGLWMIEQGGFSRENAINNPKEFADLIYSANPYGVNDMFNLTYDEWMHVQSVHNAFLGIGASYGPIALLFLLSIIVYISVVGWKYKHGTYFYSVCLSYFLTIILFNQSQQYIHPYNLEFIVLVFCGSYVLNQSHNGAFFNKKRIKN